MININKVILAVGGILAASIGYMGLHLNFGRIPSKSDRYEYRKRTANHNGKRFTYPDKWKIDGLSDDVRVSAKGTVPYDDLPVYAPNFSKVNPNKVNVTWFGHSSVLLQMHGMNILIDPIFSERSSPFQWIGPKRFSDTSVSVDELPHIDMVLITHDHYDHLDRLTIRKLNRKTDRFIVSLGIENHLKCWKISPEKITALAWWEQVNINGLEITCTPSRHFSGRGLIGQNSTQWCSWVLREENHTVFDSGDSSFGGHFEEIHSCFGDFDFAIMECGQYNKNWHYSHLYPEESVMAAEILGAKNVMPIHWGAFVLSNHGWDDSPERFTVEAEKHGMNVITPHLGETFSLDDMENPYDRWWRNYR